MTLLLRICPAVNTPSLMKGFMWGFFWGGGFWGGGGGEEGEGVLMV